MRPEKTSKKGDVSITILVVGVVAVCVLAILSFFVSNLKSQDFVGPEVFGNISASVESFYFYVNSGLSYQEAADKVGAKIQGSFLVLKSGYPTSISSTQVEQHPITSILHKKQNPIISVLYKKRINSG